MKKFISENIYSLLLICIAPIAYWVIKNHALYDVNFETKTIILSIILVLPFIELSRVFDRLGNHIGNKPVTYLLNLLEVIIYEPILLVALMTLNKVTDIFIINLFCKLLLTPLGLILLTVIFVLFGTVTIIAEVMYEKYHTKEKQD